MAGITVTIHAGGMAELEALARKELTKRAIKVTNKAKRLCPVDTGRLRSSITYEVVDGGGDVIAEARVGTNVDYAPHVEFGTARAPAQPFLRPALDAARGGP